jgi:hypothetical protein
MNPTQADLALNLSQKLSETEQAIAYLRTAGQVVPEEAFEIASILRRAIFAEQETIRLQTACDAMHKQLQAVDWNGKATADLVEANRDELLKKHQEAIRLIRVAVLRDDCRQAMRIMDVLSLFHPMHGESWCGWPSDPVYEAGGGP